MDNSFVDAFDGVFHVPPVDVIIGIIGILFFGIVLGALMYLPVAQKHSKLSLEYLSGELIWKYLPDWWIFFLGCVLFLIVSFLMVSGYLRDI